MIEHLIKIITIIHCLDTNYCDDISAVIMHYSNLDSYDINKVVDAKNCKKHKTSVNSFS